MGMDKVAPSLDRKSRIAPGTETASHMARTGNADGGTVHPAKCLTEITMSWKPHTERPDRAPQSSLIACSDDEGGYFLLPDLYT